MTIEECADLIFRIFHSNVSDGAIEGEVGLDLPDIHQRVRAMLEFLRRSESERCLAIFKRYVQARADAWGPGASNPPKALDYVNEIRCTKKRSRAGGSALL